ncbi:FHA domain containing protein [Nitzschia inconspicua]|uniref:FHA domain containing protein n=1 Tax=Nitzschia inconspicua TaxID=303405 RepID=A0A9K3LEQ6_9STRA|nr:FHA domain containing protein [Nitzschia inconspicua]
MSSSYYKEPEWAVTPSHEWTLTEIKGGVEVCRHHLHVRPTTIFGRAVEMVHIPIHHESASRQHARIAFDAQGIPWLKDLQSTHGVTVNKRKLPPESIAKTESNTHQKGSRGVMIYPGDVLQFGASTRFYTLEGPSEFERGAMQAKLQQQQLQQRQQTMNATTTNFQNTSAPAPKNSNKLDAGASTWGISMSDDESDDDGEYEDLTRDGIATTHKKTLPMDVQVPEKHRKSLEKLNALKYKLANLETEDLRIRRKGELTEGQEKQLQRNAEREEALKRTISNLEETLFDKLYPNKDNKRKRHHAGSSTNGNVDDDEDDEFFDRTKHENSSVNETTEVESETTLISKWKKHYEQHSQQVTVSLPHAEKRVSDLQKKLEFSQANGMEDAFFIQNDLQLAKEARTKLLSSISNDEAAMHEIAKLLKIVNPKLRCDNKTGYIGVGVPPSESDLHQDKAGNEAAILSVSADEMLPPPPVETVNRSKGDTSEKVQTSSTMMPPPSLTAKMESKSETMENLLPPPKRKRVIGPSMPPPGMSASPTSTQLPSSSEKPRGTLSFLNSMTKVNDSKPDTTLNIRTSQDPSSKKASKQSCLESSSQEDVWQAPADQDGSGITKLNKKFAGRY